MHLYHLGALLHGMLIAEVDAPDWVSGRPRAEKIKKALQVAMPHHGDYLLDTFGWSWEDFHFLKSIVVDCVGRAEQRSVAVP